MRALTVLALLVLGVAGAQAKFCSNNLHNKCLSSRWVAGLGGCMLG